MFFFSDRSLSSFTFFYRYLFSGRANSVIRRVSFVCFLGLIVSIGSLLIVFNVMGGLGQSIKERFLATEPHVIISFEDTSVESNLYSSDELIQKQKNKIEKILQSSGLDSGVTSFYFFENVDIVIKTQEGFFSGAVARGYDSVYLGNFLKKIQGESALFSKGDVLDEISLKGKNKKPGNQNQLENIDNEKFRKHYLKLETVQSGDEKFFFVRKKTGDYKKQIVMGLALASDLNLYEEEKVRLIPAENLLLPPGESIQFESARVGAVVSTQNAVWNAGYIFYDRQYFPSFRESSSYRFGFEMRLKDPEDFLSYKTVLEKENLSVEVWSERNSSVFFALKMEKIIMSVFLSMAALITLLAVSSLLVLLMVQKKKEMGALMAIGLSVRKVRSLFVGIGLLLCAFGMLGALLFSLFICLFLKYSHIPFLSQFHPGEPFPVEFNFLFMVLLFAGVFCLACVSCVLSVHSQFRYSPAELLKTATG